MMKEVVDILVLLSITSTPILIVGAMAYRLLLAPYNSYRISRAVIICTMLLTILAVMPFDEIPVGPVPGEDLKTVSVVSAFSVSKWAHWLIRVYCGGFLLVVGVIIANYAGMLMIIARGKTVSTGNGRIVVTEKTNAMPFSWMRYIVIGRKDYEDGRTMILEHERSHMKKYHWADLLLAQAVLAINWFNPAAWMLLSDLKRVHEFQADEAVLQSGADAKAYQMLLIERAAGRRFPQVVNALTRGSLGSRIDKMVSGKRMSMPILRMAAVSITLIIAIFAGNSNAAQHTIRKAKALSSQVFVPMVEANRSSLEGVSIVIDGKEITYEEMSKLDPNQIKSITVDKSKNENGVIYIELK